jgi:hypothetical protein
MTEVEEEEFEDLAEEPKVAEKAAPAAKVTSDKEDLDEDELDEAMDDK